MTWAAGAAGNGIFRDASSLGWWMITRDQSFAPYTRLEHEESTMVPISHTAFKLSIFPDAHTTHSFRGVQCQNVLKYKDRIY